MSPRRKIGNSPPFGELPPPRKWLLALVITAAVALIVTAITASTMVLIVHEKHRRAAVREVAALDYVRVFMAQYTSPDPFHANDYADRILDQMTGQLAQDYTARMNEIVIQVARAEPTRGAVLEAGVERWNDDGSADVLVATQIATTLPDGKQSESGNRWLATTIQEGEQWKISNLLQVI